MNKSRREAVSLLIVRFRDENFILHRSQGIPCCLTKVSLPCLLYKSGKVVKGVRAAKLIKNQFKGKKKTQSA